MITLGLVGAQVNVAPYCDECPHFEPFLVKRREHGIDKPTGIRCLHRDSCEYAVQVAMSQINDEK